MSASGYSARATAAVVGSRSTPITSGARPGRQPMKLPDPQPGSRTRPAVEARAGASAAHMAVTTAGSV